MRSLTCYSQKRDQSDFEKMNNWKQNKSDLFSLCYSFIGQQYLSKSPSGIKINKLFGSQHLI